MGHYPMRLEDGGAFHQDRMLWLAFCILVGAVIGARWAHPVAVGPGRDEHSGQLVTS
jgi:hypothetical protein